MTTFLGICVDYNEAKGILNISNEPLIDGSLWRFGLADADLNPTLVASGMRIELDKFGKSLTGPYSELVGVLLYLANTYDRTFHSQ